MLPMSEVRVPPQGLQITEYRTTHVIHESLIKLMLPMSEVRVPPQGLNRIPTLI